MSGIFETSEFTAAGARNAHKRAIDALSDLYGTWAQEMRLRAPGQIRQLENDLVNGKKLLQADINLRTDGFSDIHFFVANMVDGKPADREAMTSFTVLRDDDKITDK